MVTGTHDFFTDDVSTLGTKDREALAREAVNEFRKLQGTLTAYARMLTGNQKIRVEVSKESNGATDGLKIYYRPPLELGMKPRHNRSLCDKRDEILQLKCPACKSREAVLVVIYHEIAHLAFGSFDKVSENDLAHFTKDSVRETEGYYAEQILKRIEAAPYWQRGEFMPLAHLISEWLPILLNSLEDARVNRMMFKARPGTKVMFDALVKKIMDHGVLQVDNSHMKWSDYPLNHQVLLGTFCVASKYDITDWFNPKVEEDLKDEKLTKLLAKVDKLRTVSGSYRLAFPVLARLRELGYCQLPEDPEEPEKDDEQSEEPEPTQDEKGASEESEGESADGEGDGESASADAGNNGSEGASEGTGEAGGDSSSGEDPGGSGSGESGEEGQATEANGSGGKSGGDSVNGEDPDKSGESTDSNNSGGSEGDGDESGDESGGEASADDGNCDSPSGTGENSSDREGQSEVRAGGSEEGTSDAEQDQSDSESSDHASDEGDQEAGEPADSGGNEGSVGKSGSDLDGSDQDGSDGSGSGQQGDNSDLEESSEDSSGLGTDGNSSELGGEVRLGGDSRSGKDGTNDVSESEETLEEQSSDGQSESSSDHHEDGSDDNSDSSDSGGDASSSTGDSESGREGSDSSKDAHGSDSNSDNENDVRKAEGDQEKASDWALPETEEDAEPVDTGEDLGEGGIPTEEASQPPMGDPEGGKSALLSFGDHEHEPQSLKDERDLKRAETVLQELFDKAIVQSVYFETGSTYVRGVREHYYDKHIINHDGSDASTGWSKRGEMLKYGGYSLEEAGVRGDFDPQESQLGPALLRLRKVFADNETGGQERHKRSGRVDRRSLGKRAPIGDGRVFHKKWAVDKKDYFVIICIDISGSTYGKNLVMAKKAALAQSVLLHRLGIPFVVLAHSAYFDMEYINLGTNVDIYHVKDEHEPWTEKTAQRLKDLCPAENNLDGHTIEYYRKLANKSTATERIIMYYTDGKMPAENYEEELEILQREIRYAKRDDITLMGVGIRTDSPVKHGLDTVRIDSSDDIIKVVGHLEKRLSNR